MVTTTSLLKKKFSDILIDYNVTNDDISLLASYYEIFKPEISRFIDDFYTWMENKAFYREFFTKQNVLSRVKKAQLNHWHDLFSAEINDEYLEKRFIIGKRHAQINLPIDVYIAGMTYSQEWWVLFIDSTNLIADKDKVKLINVFNKFIFLDIGIVSVAYSDEMSDIIVKQSNSLSDLSTPTIQLWEQIIVLPIIGILDSKRALDMTDSMLNKIIETNSKVAILDIQGVPAVDSSVANHLIKITKACYLLGCECILSGISPNIAQTLVSIGVDLSGMTTKSNLRDAFKQALIKVDYKVTKLEV